MNKWRKERGSITGTKHSQEEEAHSYSSQNIR